MLTSEQLTNLNWKLIALKNKPSIPGSVVDDYELMLTEIKQLHATLTAKDRVLSQFADSENWQYEAPAEDESFPLWAWAGDDNPVHLANQALSEGKE